MELLTGDTIDISGCLYFELYDLVWFWKNQSNDTKPMLGQWLGLSHRFGSALCFFIISDKGIFLSCTTVHRLTADKLRGRIVQERIHDYHGFLEAALGSKYFGTNFYVYASFINYGEEFTVKGGHIEEVLQVLPYSTEI